jgi:predicted  nucleic acid-binding Zn-ribbon protein
MHRSYTFNYPFSLAFIGGPMRILWFGDAQDSMKESRSHAWQARRLFKQDAKLVTRIERTLEDAAELMPGGASDAHVRQFEVHIDIIKRRALEMREHLTRLEASVETLEKHLKQAKKRAIQEHRAALQRRAA